MEWVGGRKAWEELETKGPALACLKETPWMLIRSEFPKGREASVGLS